MSSDQSRTPGSLFQAYQCEAFWVRFKRYQEASEDRCQQRGREVSCLPQKNDNSEVSCKAGPRCRNTGTHLGNAIKSFSHNTGSAVFLLPSAMIPATRPYPASPPPSQTRQHRGSLPVPQGQDNHLGWDSVHLIPDGSDV